MNISASVADDEGEGVGNGHLLESGERHKALSRRASEDFALDLVLRPKFALHLLTQGSPQLLQSTSRRLIGPLVQVRHEDLVYFWGPVGEPTPQVVGKR